jgi:hypothetical protein
MQSECFFAQLSEGAGQLASGDPVYRLLKIGGNGLVVHGRNLRGWFGLIRLRAEALEPRKETGKHGKG